jgi:5'-3' exonuclease
MILTIDADLVAYRCAASVEPHGECDIAILRCDRLMRQILYETDTESCLSFLSGKDNFRYKINPDYKANRKDTPPPRFLEDCKEYLVTEWHSQINNECEADDLLGIAQTEETIIASLDKDLMMIPGWHYSWEISGSNWTKEAKLSYVTPLEGLQMFYKQMLIGDTSDNIFGVERIGKVKAAKLLDHVEEEEEMIDIVFGLYKEDAQRFYMNAQCLWILQKEGETWAKRTTDLTLPNLLKQEVDQKLSSMKYLTEGISMEVITSLPKISGILANGVIPDFMEISYLP